MRIFKGGDWYIGFYNTKHYALRISLREKLKEADLLSQLKVRASGHFNEKVY
ncbi:hypothetical protein HpBT106_13280 [Helicobacter pylori]